MSQIVTVTDVIMWRSKWDSGVWQQAGRGVRSAVRKGRKRRKWFMSSQYYSFLSRSSGFHLSLSSFFTSFSPGFIILSVSSSTSPRCLLCACCLTNLINCVWLTAQILVETHSPVCIHSSSIISSSPISHYKTGMSNQITEKSNDQYYRK